MICTKLRLNLVKNYLKKAITSIEVSDTLYMLTKKAFRFDDVLISHGANIWLMFDSFSICCGILSVPVWAAIRHFSLTFSQVFSCLNSIFFAHVHKHQLSPSCNYLSICSHPLWHPCRNMCLQDTLHGSQDFCSSKLLLAAIKYILLPKMDGSTVNSDRKRQKTSNS